jgi:SAM-dependent methyltransferase
MAQKFSSHLGLAQNYWKNFLKPEDHAIDATCGNGQDSLFLAQIVSQGQVFAFDIQEPALENAFALLKENLMEDRVPLYLASHENLHLAPSQAIRLIVYNLGYLPRGDKRITTLALSTQNSIRQALAIIEKNRGAMSIMCYPGHEEGKKEQELLLKELASLSPKSWEVLHHQWVNRSLSPSLFWIKNII